MKTENKTDMAKAALVLRICGWGLFVFSFWAVLASASVAYVFIMGACAISFQMIADDLDDDNL